jgi:hypothetical protein
MRLLPLASARILLLFVLAAGFLPHALIAQPRPDSGSFPEDHLRVTDMEAHLRFLAADEMQGRMTGTPQIDLAARYIAEQFRRSGASSAPGIDDYLQAVPFVRRTAATGTRITLGDRVIQESSEFFQRAGGPIETSAEVVYVGKGATAGHYEGLDVRGRIVLADFGTEGEQAMQANLAASDAKRLLASERGAVALIERYDGPTPWVQIAARLNASRLELVTGSGATTVLPWFMADARTIDPNDFPNARISSPGVAMTPVTSYNVAAFVPGTDPSLGGEVIVLVAHYDHIGTRPSRAGEAPTDSIFNGARDNGFGVVALLGAAEALARQPAARPVLLLAVTAEEMGLQGSGYYLRNPLLPVNAKSFALNSDGGGYSDTTLVTVIGWGRTSADAYLAAGAARFGLSPLPDPAPEQNLFDRSDNVHFARAGIPTVTFSPGFRSFSDPDIQRHYHTTADVPWTVNFRYLTRFVQAFVHSARLLADSDEPVRWTPGDPYSSIR